MYIPNTDKYPYPEDTSGHYLEVTMDRGIIFDKNYPFVDNSKGFRFKRFWVRLLLCLIVFPMARIRFGVKISGKSNLKRNKEILKNGAITIANHVCMWDYIMCMKALHNYSWTYLLSWDKNINGPDGPLVRMVGGIPIPEGDKEATVAFNEAIKKLLDERHFLHIYPEGSMWEYYAPIRPFKNGAASIAVKHNKPVIPLGFSYRKAGWLRRKLFKQDALFNLKVGKPLFPNPNLNRNEQIKDLTIRMHSAICYLSGNHENKYNPIYNNSKRID